MHILKPVGLLYTIEPTQYRCRIAEMLANSDVWLILMHHSNSFPASLKINQTTKLATKYENIIKMWCIAVLTNKHIVSKFNRLYYIKFYKLFKLSLTYIRNRPSTSQILTKRKETKTSRDFVRAMPKTKHD